MKDILTDLDRWQQDNEELAMATLVRVRGSAPRLPGARLCVTRSGKMAGSVSGGCVESDVVERARQVLDSGRPVLTTYGIADETAFSVGLSCGGSIDVLIEPVVPSAAWQAVRDAVETGRPASLGVGLQPAALIGRKLTVLGDGTMVGSIDPAVDRMVAGETAHVLQAGGTRVVTFPWHEEPATVFIEAFSPPLRLIIVGATQTAIPLCRMAKILGLCVSVIDPRSTFATGERFPDADEIIRAWPDEALKDIALDPYACIVILTHDPKFDLPSLTRALRSEARYVGVIGSRQTHARREARLREEGFGATDLARIRAPIGLDIGARNPEEIALAILAEMLAVGSGRDGRPLKERRRAIHADG